MIIRELSAPSFNLLLNSGEPLVETCSNAGSLRRGANCHINKPRSKCGSDTKTSLFTVLRTYHKDVFYADGNHELFRDCNLLRFIRTWRNDVDTAVAD